MPVDLPAGIVINSLLINDVVLHLSAVRVIIFLTYLYYLQAAN